MLFNVQHNTVATVLPRSLVHFYSDFLQKKWTRLLGHTVLEKN